MTRPEIQFDMTPAEAIETIVDCYMRRGTTKGALGTLTVLSCGAYRVETPTRCVIVHSSLKGWVANFKGLTAEDRELYVAVDTVLRAGESVNATRNVAVSA